MARGDLTVFQEAKAYMYDGDWASTDIIKLALITNAVVPTAGDSVPGMNAGATTTYTEVTAGASGYVAGGATLATYGTMVSQTAGTMTFDDDSPSVTWTQDANSPTNAYYAVAYNSDDTGLERAVCYIDLAGPVDMTAGDLTITWNANGIFTVA